MKIKVTRSKTKVLSMFISLIATVLGSKIKELLSYAYLKKKNLKWLTLLPVVQFSKLDILNWFTQKVTDL